MNETTPSSDTKAVDVVDPPKARPTLPGPLRCLLGALVAGVIAYALYNMTASIAHSFATKPVHSSSYIVQRITAAVRTLVVGMSAMGTGIFGLASAGLFGLGIQVLIQRLRGQSFPPANS
jgi:high-affinity Fe2+/Pb2+ permease